MAETKPAGIKAKLIAIQNELKAPKNRYNIFGKYNYRSCEDILEAVKPLLKKYGVLLLISDEIEQRGERYYVKATAYFEDVETDQYFRAIAYAREEETKKGSEGAQISGASSSYARKYALNGALLIDDNKDPDTDEYHTQTTAKSRQKPQIADNSGNLPKAEPVAKKRYFCDVCGKEVSEAYALKSIAKCGHIYCSAECKTKGDKIKEETKNA